VLYDAIAAPGRMIALSHGLTDFASALDVEPPTELMEGPGIIG
jgi:hypothetical protein